MALYLKRLAEKLDQDRVKWRRDTVVLLDGAQYHLSPQIQTVIRKLGITVLFTGPRSYDACPAELIFAYFKNKDVNPMKVKTGKT